MSAKRKLKLVEDTKNTASLSLTAFAALLILLGLAASVAVALGI